MRRLPLLQSLKVQDILVTREPAAKPVQSRQACLELTLCFVGQVDDDKAFGNGLQFRFLSGPNFQPSGSGFDSGLRKDDKRVEPRPVL